MFGATGYRHGESQRPASALRRGIFTRNEAARHARILDHECSGVYLEPVSTNIEESIVKPEVRETPIPCAMGLPSLESQASDSHAERASSASTPPPEPATRSGLVAVPDDNRGEGAAATGCSRPPHARPVAPSPLPLSPFTLLIPDEKFATMSDQAKAEYYAVLRDQFRRLLQLCRHSGIDPAEVLYALWGPR